jgi:hypothetical protein
MTWLTRLETLVRGDVWKGEEQSEVKVNESVLHQLVSQGFPAEAARVLSSPKLFQLSRGVPDATATMQRSLISMGGREDVCAHSFMAVACVDMRRRVPSPGGLCTRNRHVATSEPSRKDFGRPCNPHSASASFKASETVLCVCAGRVAQNQE